MRQSFNDTQLACYALLDSQGRLKTSGSAHIYTARKVSAPNGRIRQQGIHAPVWTCPGHSEMMMKSGRSRACLCDYTSLLSISPESKEIMVRTSIFSADFVKLYTALFPSKHPPMLPRRLLMFTIVFRVPRSSNGR